MEKKAIDLMVEEFQCPGCAVGSDTTNCGVYELNEEIHYCRNHVLGTLFTTPLGLVNVALGLPKGFNRSGRSPEDMSRTFNKMLIRLWLEGSVPNWDRLNVPVWALEQDGYLFVRTYMPRMDVTYVDVVKGGTLDMVPRAINVAEFIDEID